MGEKNIAIFGFFLLAFLSVVMFSTGVEKFTGNAYYVPVGSDSGYVVVSVNIPRAEIYVDDKLIGNADYSGALKINNLKRGYHKFTAKKDNKIVTVNFFVNIGSNNGQKVSLYLE